VVGACGTRTNLALFCYNALSSLSFVAWPEDRLGLLLCLPGTLLGGYQCLPLTTLAPLPPPASFLYHRAAPPSGGWAQYTARAGRPLSSLGGTFV